MANTISFDAAPVLALLRAQTASHELSHLLGMCLVGKDIPGGTTMTIQRQAGGGFIAFYPGEWKPKSVAENLITSASGPVGGAAFGDSILRTSTSPSISKSLQRIVEADGVDLLIQGMADRAASNDDRRTMLLAGFLAGSQQLAPEITRTLRAIAFVGVGLATHQQGQTLALMAQRGLDSEQGEFSITASAVRGLVESAAAFYADQANQPEPEPAEAEPA